MSYRALNWAWEADLPMAQKFVLVALADMADEKETCYPGQERLAEMTGMSVSTVRRALKVLEDAGALSRQARGIAGGGRTSDRYFLNTKQPICTVRGNRSSETPKPVNDDAETGHSDRGTPREPSEESPDTVGQLLGELWNVWPATRRSTKKVAGQSVRGALKVADAETILEAARRHSEVWSSWPESDTRFVPLLSTWLNQERWTGSLPMARMPQPGRLSVIDAGREADAILAGLGVLS